MILANELKLLSLLLLVFVSLATWSETYLTISVEAREKSKTEQKKSSASKTLSKKQLEAWIHQLSEGNFRERRTASNNLLKAGKRAIPALVKGAQRKDAEFATRCVDIVIKMYQNENETLKSEVVIALCELEKFSKLSVSHRAKNDVKRILQQDTINTIYKLRGGSQYRRWSEEITGRLTQLRDFVETIVQPIIFKSSLAKSSHK